MTLEGALRGSRTGSAASPLDHPGFGLSVAPPRYRYTVAEHARVVEGFITRLGLPGITLMGQDPSACR
jgi:pimeloyl-ACP methyl ester carboxylesterase